MDLKLDKFEKELLLQLFSDKEKYCLGKIKSWRNELTNPLTKDFAESQIFYYEQELINLKSIQLKLTRLGVIFK